MTFEEWWDNVFKAPAHGLMEEHMREAFEAGWRQGHKEGYVYRETVAMSTEGGV